MLRSIHNALVFNACTGTKVVMSVGPASHAVDVMVDLMQSGAVGARVDLTWGSLDFHKQSLRNLQVCFDCCRVLHVVGSNFRMTGRAKQFQRTAGIDCCR